MGNGSAATAISEKEEVEIIQLEGKHFVRCQSCSSLQPVYDMLTTSTSIANQRYTCVRTLTTCINHIKRTYPVECAADLIATDEAKLGELQREEESAKLLCNIPLYYTMVLVCSSSTNSSFF
jgi:hypothetical protein